MQCWTLVIDTFRELRDKKLFWVMLVISTMVAMALACIGFDKNGWSLFFGAFTVADPVLVKGSPQAASVMAAIVSNFLIGTYIGWMGVVVFLVVTAGIFPSFVESRAIEVVLGKPMSRASVFLGKYTGGLVFVLVQATYFVVLTFLVLRFQLGIWLWGYLWSIPLLVILFSYIYCVSVLLAIWSRSAMMALICALLFWVSIAGVTIMERQCGLSRDVRDEGVVLAWSERDKIGKASLVMSTIMPKTDDICMIAGQLMGASNVYEMMMAVVPADGSLEEEEVREIKLEDQRVSSLSAVKSIGSSLVFECVVLLIALQMFRRRDF